MVTVSVQVYNTDTRIWLYRTGLSTTLTQEYDCTEQASLQHWHKNMTTEQASLQHWHKNMTTEQAFLPHWHKNMTVQNRPLYNTDTHTHTYRYNPEDVALTIYKP